MVARDGAAGKVAPAIECGGDVAHRPGRAAPRRTPWLWASPQARRRAGPRAPGQRSRSHKVRATTNKTDPYRPEGGGACSRRRTTAPDRASDVRARGRGERGLALPGRTGQSRAPVGIDGRGSRRRWPSHSCSRGEAVGAPSPSRSGQGRARSRSGATRTADPAAPEAARDDHTVAGHRPPPHPRRVPATASTRSELVEQCCGGHGPSREWPAACSGGVGCSRMDGATRVLVLANRTADSPELRGQLLARHGQGPIAVTMLAPAIWEFQDPHGGTESA